MEKQYNLRNAGRPMKDLSYAYSPTKQTDGFASGGEASTRRCRKRLFGGKVAFWKINEISSIDKVEISDRGWELLVMWERRIPLLR